MSIRFCSAVPGRLSFLRFSSRESVCTCPLFKFSSSARTLVRSTALSCGIEFNEGCSIIFRRHASNRHSYEKANETRRLKSFVSYILACGLFMLGAAYAGVPLYKMICQSTGYGGEIRKGHNTSKVETMEPVRSRVLRVRFNADTASSMQWNFKPQQTEIQLIPGETALAFYKAKNPTDKPIVGISTYNVVPFEAGQYFNKIQCFCFEEQRLNPHEEVDMPVFFYIDPEFCDDPKLEMVDLITLSYTFFEAREGLNLQMPNYMKPHAAQ